MKGCCFELVELLKDFFFRKSEEMLCPSKPKSLGKKDTLNGATREKATKKLKIAYSCFGK